MSKPDTKAARGRNRAPSYRVVTVSELDTLVYRQLEKDGAARAGTNGPGSFVITDKDKAASQTVLPKVLNPLGKKGFRLAAVNKMECYIFSGDPDRRYEYKILTPADLDRAAMKRLEKAGALELKSLEGGTPTLEITHPEQASIQNVLPALLEEQAEDGWQLAAVNGPQLYFFVREI